MVGFFELAQLNHIDQSKTLDFPLLTALVYSNKKCTKNVYTKR